MVIRRNPDLGRQAVLWLATAFVVLIGAAACAFIILAAVENPSSHLLIMSGFFTGVILLLASMAFSRDKKSGKSWFRLWLAMRDKSDPRTVLRIGRKKSSSAQFGTNSPPSLDSIRDAAAQNVSWVPHGPPPDRRTQRSR